MSANRGRASRVVRAQQASFVTFPSAQYAERVEGTERCRQVDLAFAQQPDGGGFEVPVREIAAMEGVELL